MPDEHTDTDAAVAASDRSHESQPHDAAEVDDASQQVDRLHAHHHPTGDDQGMGDGARISDDDFDRALGESGESEPGSDDAGSGGGLRDVGGLDADQALGAG